MEKTYTAAMVVIGNEILSGRTQDKNINYVAKKMVDVGVRLVEVRIIPDIGDVIVDTIRALSASCDYVFTSGGIGPTHDDITAEYIAKSFNLPLTRHPQAYQDLLEYYGEDNLTDARLQMAQTPQGADLIPNPVSGAPGFVCENVYVMAGVPSIMHAMIDHVAAHITGGAKIETRTVPCKLQESVIASGLSDIQDEYPHVDIGSYPQYRDGRFAVEVVLRASDIDALDAAETKVTALVKELL